MTISIGLSSKYHRNINNSTVAMCNDIYVNTDPSPLAINDTRSYFRHPAPAPSPPLNGPATTMVSCW